MTEIIFPNHRNKNINSLSLNRIDSFYIEFLISKNKSYFNLIFVFIDLSLIYLNIILTNVIFENCDYGIFIIMKLIYKTGLFSKWILAYLEYSNTDSQSYFIICFNLIFSIRLCYHGLFDEVLFKFLFFFSLYYCILLKSENIIIKVIAILYNFIYFCINKNYMLFSIFCSFLISKRFSKFISKTYIIIIINFTVYFTLNEENIIKIYDSLQELSLKYLNINVFFYIDLFSFKNLNAFEENFIKHLISFYNY